MRCKPAQAGAPFDGARGRSPTCRLAKSPTRSGARSQPADQASDSVRVLLHSVHSVMSGFMFICRHTRFDSKCRGADAAARCGAALLGGDIRLAGSWMSGLSLNARPALSDRRRKQDYILSASLRAPRPALTT